METIAYMNYLDGRKPRPLLNLDSNPDINVSVTLKEYYGSLNKRLKYLHDNSS